MSSIACFAWLSSSKIGWSRIVRFIPDSSKLGHHLLANSLPLTQNLAIPCCFSLSACNLIHSRGTLGEPVCIDMLLVNESVGRLMPISSKHTWAVLLLVTSPAWISGDAPFAAAGSG